MHPPRSALLVVTGYALIIGPLVAAVLKALSFGWLMVFLLFGPVLLLGAGYALQVVIAAKVFISPKETHWPRGSALRMTIAAWLTVIGFLLLAVFLQDGGDSTYGSTFQVLLGANDRSVDQEALHDATDGLTAMVALCAVPMWLWGYIWLFIEWLVLRSARRQLRPAAPYPMQPGQHAPYSQGPQYPQTSQYPQYPQGPPPPAQGPVRYGPPPEGTPRTGD